jgi:hypothetical protein
MNHLPFEDWILSDEALSPEQSSHLQAHLMSCDSCRHLSESYLDVKQLFTGSPKIKPADGFRDRWLMRLEKEEIKTRQRQTLIMFILTGGAALSILMILGLQVFKSIDQPMDILIFGANTLTQLLSIIFAINEITSALLELVSIMIPPVWWVVFVTLISLMSILWLYSIKRIMLARRISI